MVDGEGQLANEDDGQRRDAVENHFKWVAAAAYLGCHSIRVNAAGGGTPEQAERRRLPAPDRSGRDAYDINVIVENHGGLSSDGAWLAGVMRRCDHPLAGTLPFGNFYEYDRYQGVADLMPFAKAVSAKSYAFDGEGNETKIDYARMMRIVKDAGYRGWVGVEYEGGDADERAGITHAGALERLRKEPAEPGRGRSGTMGRSSHPRDLLPGPRGAPTAPDPGIQAPSSGPGPAGRRDRISAPTGPSETTGAAPEEALRPLQSHDLPIEPAPVTWSEPNHPDPSPPTAPPWPRSPQSRRTIAAGDSPTSTPSVARSTRASSAPPRPRRRPRTGRAALARSRATRTPTGSATAARSLVARAVYRRFGICRVTLRELAHEGKVPGMRKSSW